MNTPEDKLNQTRRRMQAELDWLKEVYKTAEIKPELAKAMEMQGLAFRDLALALSGLSLANRNTELEVLAWEKITNQLSYIVTNMEHIRRLINTLPSPGDVALATLDTPPQMM